jgi:hypothetical protein
MSNLSIMKIETKTFCFKGRETETFERTTIAHLPTYIEDCDEDALDQDTVSFDDIEDEIAYAIYLDEADYYEDESVNERARVCETVTLRPMSAYLRLEMQRETSLVGEYLRTHLE